jgi:hypothetical protein
LKCHDKREKRQPLLAEDREAPVAAFPKTNVQTKVSRSLTVGESANASSLYLALLGRWFPGPNFQANRLSVLAAICDKMQLGSLR